MFFATYLKCSARRVARKGATRPKTCNRSFNIVRTSYRNPSFDITPTRLLSLSRAQDRETRRVGMLPSVRLLKTYSLARLSPAGYAFNRNAFAFRWRLTDNLCTKNPQLRGLLWFGFYLLPCWCWCCRDCVWVSFALSTSLLFDAESGSR
jgi:hypothetical protein